MLQSLLSSIRWLKWQEASPLLVGLAIVASTYAFIELADEVGEGDTRHFDEWTIRSFRRVDDPSIPIGPPWLREAGLDITALGSTAVLALVVVAATGYLLLAGRRELAVLALIASVGGALVSYLLKEAIGRDRPEIVPHLREVTTPSFPSGHAMQSAVVYLTLGMLLTRAVPGSLAKLYCVTWGGLLALLVGMSRIYLGVHYLTDVLAGWTAGIAWALFCWTIAQFLQRRGAIAAPSGETDSYAERAVT